MYITRSAHAHAESHLPNGRSERHVPNDQSHDHVNVDHMIMSDGRYVVIYCPEAQCSEALCGANVSPFLNVYLCRNWRHFFLSESFNLFIARIQIRAAISPHAVGRRGFSLFAYSMYSKTITVMVAKLSYRSKSNYGSDESCHMQQTLSQKIIGP